MCSMQQHQQQQSGAGYMGGPGPPSAMLPYGENGVGEDGSDPMSMQTSPELLAAMASLARAMPGGEGAGGDDAGIAGMVSPNVLSGAAIPIPPPDWAQTTTVMMRNLPNKYTQRMLLSEINLTGFLGVFDFLYLPIDPETNANRGYAFLNFIDPGFAWMFKLSYEGRKMLRFNSNKVVSVMPATLQGFEANYTHYASSRVNRGDPAARPLFLRDPKQPVSGATAKGEGRGEGGKGSGRGGGGRRKGGAAAAAAGAGHDMSSLGQPADGSWPAAASGSASGSAGRGAGMEVYFGAEGGCGGCGGGCGAGCLGAPYPGMAEACAPMDPRSSPVAGGGGLVPQFCPNCGGKIQPRFQFCPHCGGPLEFGSTATQQELW
mmetsp:Transcript_75307/g.211156  ORF Transcript_75307/g.211156 Transcript_75307/m.211156 type:complete len:375 (-) Transcript_75307:186-1310(-)